MTKIGVFDQGLLVNRSIFKSEDVISVLKEIESFAIRQVIFSSTKNKLENYDHIASTSDAYMVLHHLIPLPIQLEYETPHTLGRDRIAAVMGGFNLLPGQNVLVIDAGTCITFDVLTKEGIYRGGNIAPGIEMRLKAMNHFTAALPLVENQWNSKMLGKTTEQALQNGALKGCVFEINGFINSLGLELDNFEVILTGGNADLLSNFIQKDVIVNNDLVLIGLNEILNFNVQ